MASPAKCWPYLLLPENHIQFMQWYMELYTIKTHMNKQNIKMHFYKHKSINLNELDLSLKWGKLNVLMCCGMNK